MDWRKTEKFEESGGSSNWEKEFEVLKSTNKLSRDRDEWNNNFEEKKAQESYG